MPVVTGADGVPLHVDVRGDGPPVVLVHGTTGSAADWGLVRRLLQSDFRVTTYDRRGRGRSGDGAGYSFDAEVDDLQALLASAGAPAHLVGHSYGARLALEAAGRGADLLSLTLYEPPLDPACIDDGLLADLRAATEAEDWEAVLALFHPVACMPPEELARFRAVPGVWDGFLDGARTVEREAQAVASRPVDLDAAARVSAPAQLLHGGLTDAPVFLGPRDELVRRLRAELVELPGQRHTAMVGDPEAFVTAVRRLAG